MWKIWVGNGMVGRFFLRFRDSDNFEWYYVAWEFFKYPIYVIGFAQFGLNNENDRFYRFLILIDNSQLEWRQ